MGFHADYTALSGMWAHIQGSANTWGVSLNTLSSSVNALTGSSNMAGAGADSIKAYLDQTHNTIIPMFGKLMQEYSNIFAVYRQAYLDIDSDMEAVLDENELIGIQNQMNRYLNESSAMDELIQRSIRSVSDLISVSCRGMSTIEGEYYDIAQKITTVLDSVRAMEDDYSESLFEEFTNMITALTDLITVRLGYSRSAKSSFPVDSIPDMKEIQALYDAYVAVEAKIDATNDIAENVFKAEVEQAELVAAREAEERAKREKIAFGLKVVVAAASIATSIVVTAAVSAVAGPVVGAVVGGVASGVVSSAGNAMVDQYVENGTDLSSWNYGGIIKQGVIGGIVGGVTGLIGYGFTSGATAIEGKFLKSLVTNDSTLVRMGTKAAVSSVSQMASGSTKRFVSTVITETANAENGEYLDAFVGSFGKATDSALDTASIVGDGVSGAISGAYQGYKKPEKVDVLVEKEYNEEDAIDDGPYIKNGKPNGRPELSGKKKLEFEQAVYEKNLGPDGKLHDPRTGEIIDWKPGDPRKGVVDFGHKSGMEYNDMFKEYKYGKITLDELKEFQFDPDHYVLQLPSNNRDHQDEMVGMIVEEIRGGSLNETEKVMDKIMKKGTEKGVKLAKSYPSGSAPEKTEYTRYTFDFGTPDVFRGLA